MAHVVAYIDDKLFAKLCKLSQKSGRTNEETIELALKDYVANYEDFYQTELNAVSSKERSFFLSIDK